MFEPQSRSGTGKPTSSSFSPIVPFQNALPFSDGSNAQLETSHSQNVTGKDFGEEKKLSGQNGQNKEIRG